MSCGELQARVSWSPAGRADDLRAGPRILASGHSAGTTRCPHPLSRQNRGRGGPEEISRAARFRPPPPSHVRVIKKNIILQKTFERISVAKNPDLAIVNLPSTAPPPPSNLGPAGVTLWRSIMAEYDISDAGGRALLEQAAAAYDRAERLRVEIDRDGEIVRGSAGMREHPGLRGELATRSFICRTLQRLGINLEAVRMASGRPSDPAWRGHGD